MHIKFKYIDIVNFMSIGHARLDLSNQGFASIIGVNHNLEDNAKNNGSGKSALFEAIIYVLTGDTIRGTKDVVNKKAAGGCKITIEFDIDNISYKIIRTKEDSELGTNLKLFIDGKDVSGKGIRDTQKKLEEHLPELNASLIGSVIILGQGLPQRFTNNTPAGRKEVLEKLSKSDFMIEDIKERLSKRKLVLSTNLREKEDSILALTTTKTLEEQQLEILKKDKENIVPMDYDSLISQKKLEIDTVERELQEFSIKLDEIDNNVRLVQEKYNKLVYEDLKQEYTEKETELYKLYLDEIDSTIIDLNNKITSKKQEINKLDAIVDICPTCGQKLPDVHKIDTTTLKQELVILQNTLEEQNVMRVDHEKIVKEELDNLLQVQNKVKESSQRELDMLINNQKQLQIDNKEKQQSFSTLKIDYEKLLLAKENYINKASSIDQQIKDKQKSIEQVSTELLYNNNDKENIEHRLDIVTKMITTASRDFRGFLLSEIVKFIENRAKEYAQDIFQTDKIDFKLDGNNISISYADKEYETLSGGEKQKIDLIIQFAIRDMLTQFMNFSANIIVLDEIFDNLDSTGCQNVINLISTRLNDIESVFIITHHSDSLDIPYDKQLFIVKNERGISELT